jgi:hypothetical protein
LRFLNFKLCNFQAKIFPTRKNSEMKESQIFDGLKRTCQEILEREQGKYEASCTEEQ